MSRPVIDADRGALDGGATPTQEQRVPRGRRSGRPTVAWSRPPTGAFRAMIGIRRPHVDHVDEGVQPDRILGGEDRALQLGAGDEPAAPARGDPGDK